MARTTMPARVGSVTRKRKYLPPVGESARRKSRSVDGDPLRSHVAFGGQRIAPAGGCIRQTASRPTR